MLVSVAVIEHQEDEPYWTDCKAMMGRFLAAQSHNVQAIAGATVSSEAMKKALANAMESAKV